jgi:defect-in-organelle-trafficking protein DotA
MVAAPLVALGVTHPKGHDWLGKSEQSLMLLLSVFMRPVLMVIGLLTAMVLSRVAISMLNAGFHGIMADIFAYSNKTVLVGPVIFIAFLAVYTTLVMSIANVCFSLIALVPEKVMRWLGLTPEHGGIGKEAAQAVERGMQQQGQAAASGMAEGVKSRGGERTRSMAQKIREEKAAKDAKNKQGGGDGMGA